MPRSDSKNANDTCKGLTSMGRPCRRSLAASPGNSRNKVPTTTTAADEEGDPAYCWQHKDQSPSLTPHTAKPQGPPNGAIKGRTSIDTLVDRLGIMELEKKKKKRRTNTASNHRPQPRPAKEHGLLHMLCCLMCASDEPRPTSAATQHEPARPSTQSMSQTQGHQRRSSIPSIRPPPGHQRTSSASTPNQGRRPSAHSAPPSQTAEIISWIPTTVSPQVHSLLVNELAKPISSGDVPGYIYIFWLTDEKVNKPPARTASTLLPPSGEDRPRGAGGRRTSDVIQSYSSPGKPAAEKKLLLKIGRANNVQRRLNEWTRQCGYDVSLIRYYPYVESSSRTPSPPGGSPAASPGAGPRMVPNVHKVERLIHLELDEQRLSGKGKCERCGTLHKEWFEVDATREGLKNVDGAIRRWVKWAEQNA